jgi:hypothetical protein
MKDRLDSVNGQIVIMGAFRYALGRQTYVVSSVIEWLQENWDILEQKSKFVIMRDTAAELMDGMVGADFDDKRWREFLAWGINQEDKKFETDVRTSVAWKDKLFPLDECSDCGMVYYNCVCSHDLLDREEC